MLLSLLILAAPLAQASDAYAPAREGKIQCVVPNKEKKTCVGTTALKIAADGSYEATTWLFLNPTPLITMEVHTKGKIAGGKACETVRTADFQAGTVYLAGKPADDATSNAVKTQFATVLGALEGKTTCSEIKPANSEMLLNEVSVDSAVRPDFSQKFIWVSPKDGYNLGM